ncbi:MAG: Gfo/Idh/MocA family oxidoreductase [bacterium]
MVKPGIAVISAGKLACSQHLSNLAGIENVYFKTVCDLDKSLVEKAQKSFNIPYGTTDFNEVINDPEIQGLIVATRADTHAELATRALAAGKHVYVEKPLAETSEECEAIGRAADEAGKICAIGFNRRMAPCIQKAKSLIQAHGGASSICYRLSDAYFIYKWVHGKKGHEDPNDKIVHEICHIFDLMRYLTGSEAEYIHNVSSRANDDIITLKFKNGSTAVINSCSHVSYEQHKEYMEVMCREPGLFYGQGGLFMMLM